MNTNLLSKNNQNPNEVSCVCTPTFDDTSLSWKYELQPKNDPSTIGRLTIAALLDGQIRISELFVAEGFRKNGLGTYLLERARIDLMDAFSQRGIHP